MIGEGGSRGERMLQQEHHEKGSGGAEKREAKKAPEHLHPELQKLWMRIPEIIDEPPDDYFRADDENDLHNLRREYNDEITKIARRTITPRYAPNTEEPLSEGLIHEIEQNVKLHIQLLEKSRAIIELIKDRREERYEDTLTGAFNLAGIENRFSKELKKLQKLPDTKIGKDGEKKEVEKVMVLVEFDIDNFKMVNEDLGHAGADKKIIELVQKVKSVLKSEDVVGRRSGDEMTIILNDIDPEDLPSILQRITMATNEIDIGKVNADGIKEDGKMSVTGSARIITKAEAPKMTYAQANEDADNGANYGKIDNPGRITVWSEENTQPSLDTYAERWVWADKLAAAKIKRDVGSEHANLRKMEQKTDQYRLTLKQLKLLEGKIHEAWTQYFTRKISIDHGDLPEMEKGILPDYASTPEKRREYATKIVSLAYEDEIKDMERIIAHPRDNKQRKNAQKLLDNARSSLETRIEMEIDNLAAEYSHMNDYVA